MSEYIEREAAINGLAKIINESDMPEEWNKGMSAAMSALYRIPAADVRPVVLCRDCKYWFNAPVADGFNSCELDALIRHENFFCAAGEKREES